MLPEQWARVINKLEEYINEERAQPLASIFKNSKKEWISNADFLKIAKQKARLEGNALELTEEVLRTCRSFYESWAPCSLQLMRVRATFYNILCSFFFVRTLREI